MAVGPPTLVGILGLAAVSCTAKHPGDFPKGTEEEEGGKHGARGCQVPACALVVSV